MSAAQASRSKIFLRGVASKHFDIWLANGRAVSLICALSRFRVYPDVAVAPAKALMVDLPHASIHRD